MKVPAGRYLPAIGVVLAVLIVALLYLLTEHESQEDPCATPQNDVSAAILADDADDTDGLANRAIVQRGACDPRDE